MSDESLEIKEQELEPGMIDLNAMANQPKPQLSFSRFQTPAPEAIPEGSLLGSLFFRDTTIGSAIRGVGKGSFKAGETDPDAFIKFVPERYMHRFDAYALVTNQEEADTITIALDKEEIDTQRIAASPIKSFFYSFVTQPLDPVNYLPGGTIWNNYKKLSRVGKAALNAGTAGLISGAAQEAIIQQNQLTRDADESINNMLSSGIFSTLFGAGASLYQQHLGTYTHAAMQKAKTELNQTISDTVEKAIKDGIIDPNDPIFPKWAKFGMIQSIKNRMVKSEFSSPKQVADEIYAADWITNKNKDGVPTRNVESQVSLDISKNMKTLIDAQDVFFKQAGVTRGFRAAAKAEKAALTDPTGQILNWDAWEREVARHLMSGAESPNASVNEAVKIYRDSIFDPYKERMIALGDLPDGVTPKNAPAYFSQHWNRDAIVQDQAGFLRDTLEGFTDVNNANKKIRKDPEYKKAQEEITSLKKDIKKAKKKQDKKELKTLNESLKKKEKSLNQIARNIAGTILDEFEVESLFHTKGSRKGQMRSVSTEAELELAANQSMQKIIGNDTSKVNSHIISELDGKPPPLRDRTFLLSQERMWNWMDQSASSVAGKYIHSMAPATRMGEMAKENGFKSINEWYQSRVKDLQAELKAKSKDVSGKAAEKLDKEFKKQKDNIKSSFEMMLGIYGDGPNVHDGSYVKFYKAFLNWNYIRLLGYMTLSSIPDLGLHVFTHGIYATIHDGLRPVLKQALGTMKGFSRDDLQAIGVAINTAMGSRLKAMAGNDLATQGPSFFGKTFDRAVQTFGNVTLMNQWNDQMQLIAGTMSINRSLKSIESIVTGKKTPKIDRERLARLGISEEQMPMIYDMWQRSGANEVDGTYFADWVNWKPKNDAQIRALDAFQTATLQEIHQVVISPGLGDKPAIAQTGWGKLLLQFKSFSFAATNKIFFSGMQRAHDKNMWFGSATMLGLGALSYVVTQMVRGNDDIDLSFETLSQEAFDRSGLLGIISEVHNLANKAGLGFSKPTSRFQSRGIWGTLLGPSVGSVEDLLDVVNRIRKADEEHPLTTKDLQKLFRLSPYQNLFYTDYLSKQVLNKVGPKVGFEAEKENRFKNLFK